MVAITFIEHEGTEHRIDATPGVSLMQAAVDNMVPGVLADCGGACACATCHCYVEKEWLDKAGEPDAVEQPMLEFAIEPNETSRLSCQITVSEDLDGMVIRLPSSQL